MMKEPLVSVCIPNYNYGHFIEMAIKSACEQSYSNIEVVVVDNASTDQSIDIIASLQQKYQFRFVRNERNIGMVENFNKCMELSNGEFVLFLSSDDVLKPQFVSRCMELFSTYDVGMVAAHCDGIDDQHNVADKKPFYESSGIIKGQEHAKIFLMTGVYFPSQVLIRKKTLQSVGGWNTKYPIFFDWYLWFCISLKSNIGYIRDSLVSYREHDHNASSASIKNLQMIFEKYLLKLDFFSLIKGNGYLMQFKEEAIRKLAANCMYYVTSMLKINEYELAKKYFDMIQVFDPSMPTRDDYKILGFCLSLKTTDPLKVYLQLVKNFDDYSTKRPFALPKGSIILC